MQVKIDPSVEGTGVETIGTPSRRVDEIWTRDSVIANLETAALSVSGRDVLADHEMLEIAVSGQQAQESQILAIESKQEGIDASVNAIEATQAALRANTINATALEAADAKTIASLQPGVIPPIPVNTANVITSPLTASTPWNPLHGPVMACATLRNGIVTLMVDTFGGAAGSTTSPVILTGLWSPFKPLSPRFCATLYVNIRGVRQPGFAHIVNDSITIRGTMEPDFGVSDPGTLEQVMGFAIQYAIGDA